MNNRPPQTERRNITEAIAEAESTPIQFLPKERAIYIRDMVKKIETLKKLGKTNDEIKAEVSTFERDYKNLFDMITAPIGYDKQDLLTMLAMLDRMGKGDLNQHQASVIVGQRLAAKYIKPEDLPPP